MTTPTRTIHPVAISPEKMKDRRERLKLTQHDVAAAAGVAQPAYARIESGRNANPKINLLQAIAAALKCRVDDLLEG